MFGEPWSYSAFSHFFDRSSREWEMESALLSAMSHSVYGDSCDIFIT